MSTKRINIAEIKKEAKALKKENQNLKHTEALNKISQKYGYEKYEILKSKLKNTYIEIKNTILKELTEEEKFKKEVLKQWSKVKKYKKIAIVGSSGIGKTTILYLLRDNLESKQTVYISLDNNITENKKKIYKREQEEYEKKFKEELKLFENIISIKSEQI